MCGSEKVDAMMCCMARDTVTRSVFTAVENQKEYSSTTPFSVKRTSRQDRQHFVNIGDEF